MRYFLALSLLMSAFTLQAAVQEKQVNYTYQGQPMTGYLYWDDAIEGKRPGILVIHEWWGLNDYVKKRAHMLAEMGYAAFAADMYGTDKVTTEPGHAKAMMQAVTGDVSGWRERGLLGIEQLKNSELVDADRLAAIGYCFGGASVLQLAYAGAPVRGVASFHGALPPAPADAAGKINADVMVFHGEADGFVGPEMVENFQGSMEKAGADLTTVQYIGVRHGFTNPDAGSFGIENLQYDEAADRDSWRKMQTFFEKVLQ